MSNSKMTLDIAVLIHGPISWFHSKVKLNTLEDTAFFFLVLLHAYTRYNIQFFFGESVKVILLLFTVKQVLPLLWQVVSELVTAGNTTQYSLSRKAIEIRLLFITVKEVWQFEWNSRQGGCLLLLLKSIWQSELFWWWWFGNTAIECIIEALFLWCVQVRVCDTECGT